MVTSLRLRLFAIILAPLLVMSVCVGLWRISEARHTAQDLYDNSLLITALAVSRDVALADGDTISRQTEALLADTAGGLVRYHVYAPDGVFVTGYAVPPIPVGDVGPLSEPYVYFDALYKGRPVRVLRLNYITQIDGFSGAFTVTVWQDQTVRGAFVATLAYRAIAVISALILTTALVVWFGVHLGLKPLLDLEDAISRRNPEDLSPIQRRVPIEARGLVKSFDGTRAVDGVDISVPEGAIYGILGPNGAGKTTTLRMLLGIIDPDEGVRRVFGQDRPHDIGRLIGYLPEARGLYPSMKAVEAIAFMGALRGLPKAEGRKRGLELLERHDLGHAKDRQIRQLSKGMAQTVQLLGTLVHRPKLVVLDEPFSGLDAINQGKLERMIRALGPTASRTAIDGLPWVRQVSANMNADIDGIWGKIDHALGT